MVIFNEAKPKYTKLDELLEMHLNDIRYSNQVNIIVDVKELIRKFFRPDIVIDNKNRRSLIEEISSDIINTIGHYRNYFYKKGKYTTFYFLYSYEKCDLMIKKYPDYKKEYYEKYFNKEDNKVQLVKRAIQAVEAVVKLTPHAMFINTSDYDEFLYAKYVCETVPANELTLILSNDDIFFQLIKENVFVLDLKGIKSDLLTPTNLMQTISGKDDCSLSSNSLSLVLALSGSKKYTVKSLPNVALLKGVNIVTELIKRDVAKDVSSIEIPLDFTKLNSKLPLDKKIFNYRDTIIDTYKLVRGDDLFYTNKITISNKFVSSVKLGNTVNLFLDLNAKIYTMFPIQIDMVLKGEKV